MIWLAMIAVIAASGIVLTGCTTGDRPPSPGVPGAYEPYDDVPMRHMLKSNDWEVVDTLYGVNMPARHLTVTAPGFKLRVLQGAVIPTGEAPTPHCVDYGGPVAGQTIEVKGERGQMVPFMQGAGKCRVP